MEENKSHELNVSMDNARSLGISPEKDLKYNSLSAESAIPVFDTNPFGGFNGFKNILDDDFVPEPGVETINCRKAHPLRLKRKPKMRIPFPLPKFEPEPEWDVEPYMLEDFPEEIDWSKQYYQQEEESSTIKPILMNWDYVPPYDPEFAQEFNRMIADTPDKLIRNQTTISKFKKMPKIHAEEKPLDEDHFVDLLEEKDRQLSLMDYLQNVETNKTNEFVTVPFDGDWQKEETEAMGADEPYRYWEEDNVEGLEEAVLGAPGEEGKVVDAEGTEEAQGEGIGEWDGGRGRGRGWGRGYTRGYRSDRGFGRGEGGDRGWGDGGDTGPGWGEGGGRGFGRGYRGDRGFGRGYRSDRGFGRGEGADPGSGWGEGSERGFGRGRGYRGGFRGRFPYRGADLSRGHTRGRGRGRGYDIDENPDAPTYVKKYGKTINLELN